MLEHDEMPLVINMQFPFPKPNCFLKNMKLKRRYLWEDIWDKKLESYLDNMNL